MGGWLRGWVGGIENKGQLRPAMLELGLGLSWALSSPSTNIVASLLPNVTNCNTNACANDSTVSHLDEMQSLQLGPVFRTMGWIRTFLRKFVCI